jgi:hypothetical protein
MTRPQFDAITSVLTNRVPGAVASDVRILITEGTADYARNAWESTPAGLAGMLYVALYGTDADAAAAAVLAEITAERARQDAKWGEQNHPDGTGGAFFAERAIIARAACQDAAAKGRLTWRHILEEEFKEATAEPSPTALRAELVQVAAVAVAWIESIDRRTAAQGASALPNQGR